MSAMRSLRHFCAAANTRPISRSVAESNASLLEAFSHIIQAPETQGPAGKKFPIDFRANSLQPAQQFDPEPHVSAATHLTSQKFHPGDTYLSKDLLASWRETVCSTPEEDPFVKVIKEVDIFKRNRYDLSRIHLNVGVLSSCLSPLGQILPRSQTRNSSKTQRHLARAIKRARQMGIIPYLRKPVLV